MPPLPVLASAALCVANVHDGDTIRTCAGERIRIADIDASELPESPKCKDKRRSYAWCDYRLGYQARDALAGFLHDGAKIERQGVDRYGRTLARVTVNGKDAGAYLVSKGLARWWR
jgi:endonuclease YncB( thermonuclease family)